MKYQELIWALDLLSKYYPGYHGNQLLVLCDDAIRWFNNELPDDSSAVMYLKQLFASPVDALSALWQDVQMLSMPFKNIN